jgi:hypothetical protein
MAILAALAFLFVHSELGFCSPENHCHDSHDFCKLVVSSTNQIQKTTNRSISKPAISHFFVVPVAHDQLDPGEFMQATNACRLNRYYSSSAAIYLANSLFLI